MTDTPKEVHLSEGQTLVLHTKKSVYRFEFKDASIALMISIIDANRPFARKKFKTNNPENG